MATSDKIESVMIALLPDRADWCHIAFPHLTLVYAGQIPDLSPGIKNEMGKTILDFARKFESQRLNVDRPDIFGDNEDGHVDVLRLQPTPELMVMRSLIQHWNASEHPFNPHVTVGPVGSLQGDIPSSIFFGKIGVYWGTSKLICTFSPTSLG